MCVNRTFTLYEENRKIGYFTYSEYVVNQSKNLFKSLYNNSIYKGHISKL